MAHAHDQAAHTRSGVRRRLPAVAAGPARAGLLHLLFEAKRFLFPPKIPTANGYGSTIGKYVADARNGKITPREALDRITQEAQAELDQAGVK